MAGPAIRQTESLFRSRGGACEKEKKQPLLSNMWPTCRIHYIHNHKHTDNVISYTVPATHTLVQTRVYKANKLVIGVVAQREQLLTFKTMAIREQIAYKNSVSKYTLDCIILCGDESIWLDLYKGDVQTLAGKWQC